MKVLTVISTFVLLANGLAISKAAEPAMAGAIVFPATDKATLVGGTWPDVDHIVPISQGITKTQLRNLLGRPHFHEGLFSVREWDYILNFRVKDESVSCQFKVLFDDQYRGESFHWLPANCGSIVASLLAPVPAPIASHSSESG